MGGRTRRGPDRRRPGSLILLLVALASPTSAEPTGWAETFREGRLDPARWEVTAEGDFRDRDVDVLDVKKRGVGDFRLRLRADTGGTRDGTVKVLGVRGARKIPLGEATRISAELDWNEQANGSYLSAALVLAPTATSMNPLTSPDWVKVEYVGVPPGQNARLVVGVKVEGRERTLYAEGWPDTNRAGRNIALQQVMIAIRDRAFQVWENGQLVYDSGGNALSFDAAYLYLQLSSHSNYPAREIYFDNIRVADGD